MGTLIKNELIKIFSRGKTWVLIALFTAVCGLMVWNNYSNYQRSLENSNPHNLIKLEEDNIKEYEKRIKEYENDPTISDGDKQEFIAYSKEVINESKIEITKLEKEIKDEENGIEKNWKDEVKEQIEANNNQIEEIKNQKDISDEEKESKIAAIKVENERQQYLIDNNIESKDNYFNGYTALSDIMMMLGFLLLPIGIMTFLSDMVSGECTPATLKFLLVQPISRRKVLISKFLASMITTVVTLIGIEMIFFVGVSLFTGFDYSAYPMIAGTEYKDIISSTGETINIVKVGSQYIITAGAFLLRCLALQVLMIIASSAVALMISSIFKSSMITMAISIVFTVGLFMCQQMVSSVNKIAQYSFISYQGPNLILDGSIIGIFGNSNIILSTGIIVLIATTVISYIVSDLVFTKRDILI